MKFKVSSTAVTVTPNTADAAMQLGRDCPCGGAWEAKKPRFLLDCSAGTCSEAFQKMLPLRDWTLGADGFGVARRTVWIN